jgi:hypothetical protein
LDLFFYFSEEWLWGMGGGCLEPVVCVQKV